MMVRRSIVFVCIAICLSSCHPSNGGNTSSPQEEIQTKTVQAKGLVIDGYISGASVCLEHNATEICTTSEVNGSYSFDPLLFASNTSVVLASRGGVDTATQTPYRGTLSQYIDLSVEGGEAPLWRNITPLSDLSTLATLEGNLTHLQAKEAIAQAYGIDKSELDGDPMQESNLFVASQDIEQSKALLGVMAAKLSDEQLTQEELETLRYEVRKALAKSVAEFQSVSLDATIAKLEESLQIEVPINHKLYVIAQRESVRRALEEFANTADLSVENRADFQAALASEMGDALESFEALEGEGFLIPHPVEIDIFAPDDTNQTDPDDVNQTDPDDTNQTQPPPQEPAFMVEGRMVDGYISTATVCVDTNGDSMCGVNEPRTTTATDGTFTLAAQGLEAEKYYRVIAYGGVDTATQQSFEGEYFGVLGTFGEGAEILLTPLNDLVARMFFRSQTLSVSSLDFAQSSVAGRLGLLKTQLDLDPMSLKALMLTSMGVESIYAVIASILKEHLELSALSSSQKKSIREAMLEEFLDSGYSAFESSQVLIRIEVKLELVFDAALRDFAINQIAENLSTLRDLNNAGGIEANTFERIQRLFDAELAPALASNSYIDIDLDDAKVVYSEFDKNGASYDENACMQNEIYTHSHTLSSTDERYEDRSNGIVMGFDETKPSQLQSFTLFYPSLDEIVKTDVQVRFENDYYFSYDSAWVETGKSIYLKALTNENITRCYKIELNQHYGSYLLFEPVFRYTDAP